MKMVGKRCDKKHIERLEADVRVLEEMREWWQGAKELSAATPRYLDIGPHEPEYYMANSVLHTLEHSIAWCRNILKAEEKK